jgi:hypothetical protein
LKEEYAEVKMHLPNDDVAVEHLLAALYTCIRRVLQGNAWAKAFLDNGFGQNQEAVLGFILRQLEWESVPPLPLGQPTKAQLTTLFPKNRSVPYNAMFTVPKPRAPSQHAAPSTAPCLRLRTFVGPMTRARSAAIAASAGAGSSTDRPSLGEAVATPLQWQTASPRPRPLSAGGRPHPQARSLPPWMATGPK